DDQREPQRLRGRFAILFAGQYGMARRRQPEAQPDLLGAQLVHGQRRSEDAAAGVGNAGALEQPLHAAVFATTAMQDDECTVYALCAQALQEVVTDIDPEGVDTDRLQCTEHRCAGFEGNRTLGALAAEQHRHTPESPRVTGRLQRVHGLFSRAVSSAAKSGLLISCGARPPISPAPWQSRMSPARSSGLTSGARSTPRSI